MTFENISDFAKSLLFIGIGVLLVLILLHRSSNLNRINYSPIDSKSVVRHTVPVVRILSIVYSCQYYFICQFLWGNLTG